MDESWIIEYETADGAADRNQELVEGVFAELAATAPAGLEYASYRAAEGSAFVHVVTSAPDGASLTSLPAFAEFQRELPSRLAAPLTRRSFRRIGSYAGGRAAVPVLTGYLTAFGAGDVDAAARYLAPDVRLESPRETSVGFDAVVARLAAFAPAVTSLELEAVFGDDSRAVAFYELRTAPFGPLRVADRVEVRDGLITSDVVLFDPSALVAAPSVASA